MRVSKRNGRLFWVASAMLAIAFWQPSQSQIPSAPDKTPAIPGQNPNGIQIYLRAGLKTHGPG